ncbi:MAG: DUF4007 family protein [Syntrophaceae bacterium]|nr:DUF4007 family protein [Syntrophaceae bacterium]
MAQNRKFQVSNGYLLDFDQLARVLNFLKENPSAKKIKRKDLRESTGLSDRQLESLVSIGSAMGLIQPRNQILSNSGELIAKHDIFIEAKGTLEWCHYAGAGSYRNLFWYEVFNSLLPNDQPMRQEGWLKYFRDEFKGQYTDKTISKHLRQEVWFVVDAYLNRNFKKLEILQQASDGILYPRRHINTESLVFSAILYDFARNNNTHLLQIRELSDRPGTPGVIFSMDEPTLRQKVELLHERGWVRYESTHNLNQVRLKEGFEALDFLKAYYKTGEPKPSGKWN